MSTKQRKQSDEMSPEITEIRLDGQLIIINEYSNVIKTTIDSPFQDPSYRMHQWAFGCSGFGINAKIIDLVLQKKMRLFVHCNEDNKNYIIEYDKLLGFLEIHDVDYVVKKTKLKILPISYFNEL